MATPQKNDATRNNPSNTRNVQQNSYRADSLNTTRNVRTSTMPGSPNYQQPNMRPTVAEEFSQSYQDRLIQPQSLTDTKKNTQSQKVTREENVVYIENQSPTVSSYTQKKEAPIKPPSQAALAAARVRATTTNTGISSWGLWAWGVFQLPLAILSLIFFALAAALSTIIASATPAEGDGILVTIGKTAVSVVGKAASFSAELMGVNLGYLDPTNFFMATYFIVLTFGIIMLFSMYLIYTLRRLAPLSGQASGLKFGIFLLAFIGYSLPFLNLFPWFLVWAAAVWKYPK